MDRFKFRAYIKYAKLLEDVDSFFIDNLKEKITLHFSDGHTKTMKLSDCILRQSTGLKDKNGDLIYEGDILKNNNTTAMYEVVFRNAGFYFRLYFKKYNETIDYLPPDEYFASITEIIGNIHENEDLLEEK